MQLVGFIIRIYHDAPSPERQMRLKTFTYGQEQHFSAKTYVCCDVTASGYRLLLCIALAFTMYSVKTSHTETPTHIETRTPNQCGDTIEKSQAPDDGCINVRNMLSTEEVK